MNSRIALTIIAGFAVGAIAGFIYGQGARKQATNAVTTDFVDGKAIVTVDTVQMARGGLEDLFNAL